MKIIILLVCLLFIMGCVTTVTNLSKSLTDQFNWGNIGKGAFEPSQLEGKGIGVEILTKDLTIKKGKDKNLRIRFINYADHDITINYVLTDNIVGEGIQDGGISDSVEIEKPMIQKNQKIPRTKDVYFTIPAYSEDVLQDNVELILKLNYDFESKAVLRSICVPKSEDDLSQCRDIFDIEWGARHSPIAIKGVTKSIDYIEEDEEGYKNAILTLILDIAHDKAKNSKVPENAQIKLKMDGSADFDCGDDKIVFKDEEGYETNNIKVECEAEDIIPGTSYNAVVTLEYPYQQLEYLGYVPLK